MVEYGVLSNEMKVWNKFFFSFPTFFISSHSHDYVEGSRGRELLNFLDDVLAVDRFLLLCFRFSSRETQDERELRKIAEFFSVFIVYSPCVFFSYISHVVHSQDESFVPKALANACPCVGICTCERRTLCHFLLHAQYITTNIITSLWVPSSHLCARGVYKVSFKLPAWTYIRYSQVYFMKRNTCDRGKYFLFTFRFKYRVRL